MLGKASVVTESLLLERAKAGSSEAFSELVRMNSSSVYGISLKILKNREDAEDNLQNVFCKAYRKIRSFQGESRVSTWLFRIAINEALMQLRRRPTREVRYAEVAGMDEDVHAIPEAEDSSPDPEKRCITADLAVKAFRGCSPTMANIFVLNKAEGWTNRELAKVYGTNAQTVKSRVFRTRIRLRQQMAALSPGTRAAFQA
jgi:RNA polymerase sigma-70 factor, ECF subfamily